MSEISVNVDPKVVSSIRKVVDTEIQKALGSLEGLVQEIVRESLSSALGQRRAAVKAAPKIAPKVAPKSMKGGAKITPVTKDSKCCGIADCDRPVRSQGYCASHYQSANRNGWVKPCPVGFDPPKPKRGRPSKADLAAKADAVKEVEAVLAGPAENAA